jgi:Domain of unknown function (DUF4331)
MMKRGSVMSALTALGLLSLSSVAAASSHREAPLIANDPAADNTDTYAFVSGSNLVIVANYIGLELPEGGPNWAKFSDDVRYDIHIALGGSSLLDALTYQIHFTTTAPTRADQTHSPPLTLPNTGGIEFFSQLTGSGAFGQTYTVTQLTNGGTPTVITSAPVPVPWPNVGPETNAVAYSPAITGATAYETHWVNGGAGPAIGSLTGGGSVFAGPRDDPFWVDLGAIFDLAQLRPVANPGVAGRDSIAYMNVHAIVLSVPIATVAAVNSVTVSASNTTGALAAAQTAGVWASASRRKSTIRRRSGADSSYGPWIQVSRLGQPLINEAVIGLQDKDFFNHLTPNDDATNFAAYFTNPILVRDAKAVGLYNTGTGALESAGCDTALTNGAALVSGRNDILNTINLNNSSITTVGDVLRVNLGLASGYPNGRLLTDKTTDIIFGLVLCGATNAAALVGDVGPTANEVAFEATFPYLAAPWEGRTANPRLGNSTLSQSGQPCTVAAAAKCNSGVCIAASLTCQ